MRRIALALVLVLTVFVGAAQARSVGEVLDDTRISAEVKARLTAESPPNFVKIDVHTEQGVVTLSGTVETPEKRARAAQIASAVGGVKGLLNYIQVATAAGSPGSVPGDVTGTVASVDPASGMVTLTDGRVFKLQPGTMITIRGASSAEPPSPSASPR